MAQERQTKTIDGVRYHTLVRHEEHRGPFFWIYNDVAIPFHYIRQSYSSWDGVAEFDLAFLRNSKAFNWMTTLHRCGGHLNFSTPRGYYVFDNQVFVHSIYEDGLDNWE